MASDYEKKVDRFIEYLGGGENIRAVTNCMTRVRVRVGDESPVDEGKLRGAEDVLGLVHDRPCTYEIVVGPGKSRKYAERFRQMGFKASAVTPNAKADADWKKKKEDLNARRKESRIKSALKLLGDIFVPLIPGIIAAGLCAGFAALIREIVPDYEDIKIWSLIHNLLALIHVSFMTYLTAWAGYRAAERFGATPILGGMLGMITSLEGISEIASILGLYDAQNPLNSILREGKGGVLAVIVGVFLLSAVEKKIRSKMPESVDVIFTPLLTLLICVVPYVLIIMPVFGFVSSGIIWVFSHLCLSSSLAVRVIAGYLSAALFLPLVAAGMHHGLVALYSVQLEELGYITLYPALAMAGAGQVGASIALWVKAKRVGNHALRSVIAGALPAGFLGIGEPLIYGVTLPLGRPFLTAGLGAGFGAAVVMAAEIGSTTWGPSGILGVFVMTEGPKGALHSVIVYVIGLVVAYICSFIITYVAYKEEELCPDALEARSSESAEKDRHVPEISGSFRTIRHGEAMLLGTAAAEASVSGADAAPESGQTEFRYIVKDETGLHARPAGRLAQLIKAYDCRVTISANGKSVSADSPIELMELGASKGTQLRIFVEGADAAQAASAVRDFMEKTL